MEIENYLKGGGNEKIPAFCTGFKTHEAIPGTGIFFHGYIIFIKNFYRREMVETLRVKNKKGRTEFIKFTWIMIVNPKILPLFCALFILLFFAAGNLSACTFTPVGNTCFEKGNYGEDFISLCVYNCTPYVAYEDYGLDGNPAVMTFNGSAWVPVGPNPVISSNGGYGESLFIDNGTLYVAFADNNELDSVMEYTGGSWVYVGSPDFGPGSEFNSLYVYNGTPYIASGGTVMMYSGANWVSLGGSFGDAGWESLYVYNGTPYVAFEDGSNSNGATVKYFDGINWDLVGPPDFSNTAVGEINLVFNNSTPYISFEDFSAYMPSVMTYNGANWVYVGTQYVTTDYAETPSLCFYNNIPYVAYDTESNSATSYNQVVYESAGSWVSYGYYGPYVYPEDIEEDNLAIDAASGTMYVAYLTNTCPDDGIVVEACGTCAPPTSTPSNTPTITLTSMPSGTPSITLTSTPTYTPTGTPSMTLTPTFAISLTFTITQTPTVPPTPTPTQQPACFTMYKNSPNPCSNGTNLVYYLCAEAEVTAKIYTVSGEVVRELSQQGEPGMNSIYWDTNNNSGRGVASGVFIYYIEATEGEYKQKQWGKMAVVK